MVRFGTRVQNERMAHDSDWFSYTAGDRSHLTAEKREVVDERIRQRGELLGVVQVRVFENACEPCVTFPDASIFGVETDQSAIAQMVARARSELENWQ
jgi:hypothetical protein